MKYPMLKTGRKAAALLLALVLIITACPVAVFAEETAAKTTEYVHLRSGPGTSYSSKGVLALGTAVTVTDTSNDEWYAVKTSGGSTGYIYAKYVQLASSAGSSGASGTSAKTTEYVHLRSGPGTNYSSKGVIASGTALTVTDTSNADWYAVKLSNGTTGYMYSKYIKFEGASATPTPKPTETAEPTQAPSGSSASASTTTAVHLRSGPGTSYSSKGVLSSGTQVTVTDTSNASWYAVKLSNGTTGYIYSIYLKLSGTAAETPSTPSESVTAQTTEYVNLRSGPGTSYSSKGVLSSGTKVTVTDRSNSSWYAVKTSGGSTGYIYSIYLKILSEGTATSTAKPTATPTPTPAPNGAVQAKTTAAVNLRRGAGTNYGVIKVVSSGTTVTVTEAANTQWYKVKLSDGTEGYLFSEYLKITSGSVDSIKPTATPTPTSVPNGTVQAKTTTAINLRKGPGTTYAVIRVVDKNVTVTVTEATNSQWYKVKLSDGTEGYFSAQYLKITAGSIDSVKPSDPNNGGGGDENNGGGSSTSTGEYVRTTVGLNLRKGAGTNTSVITVLSSGTVLEVLDRKTDGWVHVRTTGGKEGYVSAQYVTAYSPSSSSASISEKSATIPQYKTVYLQASSSGTVVWSSSNTAVATVEAGVSNQVFVYGVAPGTVKIVGKSVDGKELTSCTVTVTEPEAIRFAYTTPNVIASGAGFELKAVTDTQKSAVKFEIQGVGTYETTTYSSETQGSNSVRVFTASTSISTPGTYTVRAYSNSGGGYSSSYREFTILVVSTSDTGTTTNESRRISDSMLENIAAYEGYVPTVYPDTLAGNIPTVGYGYVVSKNTAFYNNLTRSEAKAMLADTINRGSYTSEVNRFISNNNLLMSQCQFDALVSFSYNVGASYWSGSGSCYVRTVILNTVVPPQDLSSSKPYGGKVTAKTVTVYSAHDASSSKVTTLSSDDSVNITEFYRDANTKHTWYQISAGGKTGWVRAGDIAFTNTSGLTRDLSYVDAYTFGSNLLSWHVAGGKCYIGLYYRRLAEAKVFSYANYAEASPSNASYKKNTYGYLIPKCL